MIRFLLGLIRFYQWFISPVLGPRCRYFPTCSQYAFEAVTRYGAGRGGWLAAKRLCRCHPWGGSGYDPLPVPVNSTVFKPVDVARTKPVIPFIGH